MFFCLQKISLLLELRGVTQILHILSECRCLSPPITHHFYRRERSGDKTSSLAIIFYSAMFLNDFIQNNQYKKAR